MHIFVRPTKRFIDFVKIRREKLPLKLVKNFQISDILFIIKQTIFKIISKYKVVKI